MSADVAAISVGFSSAIGATRGDLNLTGDVEISYRISRYSSGTNSGNEAVWRLS